VTAFCGSDSAGARLQAAPLPAIVRSPSVTRWGAASRSTTTEAHRPFLRGLAVDTRDLAVAHDLTGVHFVGWRKVKDAARGRDPPGKIAVRRRPGLARATVVGDRHAVEVSARQTPRLKTTPTHKSALASSCEGATRLGGRRVVALVFCESVLEAECGAGGHHGCAAVVDRVDDLGVVDALQIDRRDAEVGVSELALDHVQGDTLARHFDRVRVA
jgi:hypothetical protein